MTRALRILLGSAGPDRATMTALHLSLAVQPSEPDSEDVRGLPFEDEEQISRIIVVEPERPERDHHAQYHRLHRLLAKRRYEQALDLLCSVREVFPQDEALARSIRLLRDHLSAKYAERLRDLDVVPRVVRRDIPLEEHERRVLSLVDGVSSFGELLLSSPVGQFDTLRALFNLARLGAIADDVVASASRRPPPPTAEVSPTPLEVRRLLSPLESLDGFRGSALVDSASANILGTCGADPESLYQLAAVYAELLRLQRRATSKLGLGEPQDLIITRPDEYHLLRPLGARPDVFVCLVIKRHASNLVLSRLALSELDSEVGEALGTAAFSGPSAH